MAEKAKKRATKATKKRATKAVKKAASTPKKNAKTAVSKKKTSTKKATAKKVETVENSEDFINPPLEEKFLDAEMDSLEPTFADIGVPAMTEDSRLSISLSRTLIKKLTRQAQEEGISLDDFVSELLAESVVLRAWEIVERKSQMRSTPTQNMGNRGNGNSGNNNGGRNNNRKGRGGMSHGRYQSIMDDKASFLEYVRNQERTRR